MPRSRRPDAPLPDVFVGSLAVHEGLLTARQLRGPFIERVLQGVYRPAWVPLSHAMKCRAACLVLPDAAVVTGVSAATVLGARLAGADDDVMVAVPEGITVPTRSGVVVRKVRNGPLRGRALDGVRLAHAFRMAFDAAARQPLHRAVANLDAIVRQGLVSEHDLVTWLADRGDNHVRAVRAAAALVDARAVSVPESVTRVHLRTAGFDVQPQYRVRRGSRVIARVDLAIPELKIAIEYDGRWHEDQTQRGLDNDRLAALRAAGWTVIVVTAELLRHPQRLVAVVRAAVAERESLVR